MSTALCPPHKTVHSAIIRISSRSCRPALPVRGSSSPSKQAMNPSISRLPPIASKTPWVDAIASQHASLDALVKLFQMRSPCTLTQDTLVLPSLSPIGDKPISALIDDRCTSANGGLLLFQDVEQRLNLADRLATCLRDPRQPGKITHRLDEILRFRMLAIAAGYPDGNDCDLLRDDPIFKMALDRPPVSGPALCSQPTVSRLENMPRRPELYRMAKAMLDLYCDSFPVVPSHLTLDLDESFDRGEQELRKFNAYYDDWGFLPIHIFDTSGRLVVSVLREAATPSDPDPGQAGGRPSARAVPPGPHPSARRQPLCLSGSDDPPIALRSGPEDTEARLCRGCEAEAIEYIFGLAGTAPLAAQVQ